MIQKLSAPVSIELFFDHRKRSVMPVRVIFDGREHVIKKVGMHHTFRQGRTLYHVFSAATESVFFRLVLNTDNLFWTVEEVADGEAD